jgi:glycosyltransferase involved in cell wall biosynthesis
MNALYLCYLSLLDPLVQTQVVAYLEGLTAAGHRIILLTFEPRRPISSGIQDWKKRLQMKGIVWHWLRYHKRPTVIATSWDILAGIVVGFRLVKKHNVRLIHARVHVPGVIALALKKLTGAKLLFDIRGFMAEEYVDGGVWKQDGLLFRITKRVERALVKSADACVVLTTKAKEQLMEWYEKELAGKPVQVIPCCVDLRQSEQKHRSENRKTPSLVYVGKLGGWYLTEEMLKFFAAARRLIPDLRLQIWTQSDASHLHSLCMAHELNGFVSVGQMRSEYLPMELPKYQAGLSFVKPCFSKLASSPTKIGEYLAAGLPVVSSAGIGDLDDLLKNGHAGCAVGIVVREFSEQAYENAARELRILLSDPEIHCRCRAVAEEYLDLERVGWRRYREVYGWLSG